MAEPVGAARTLQVAQSVACYMVFSSLGLVANKVAIFHLPVPGLLFSAQLAVTVAVVLAGDTAAHLGHNSDAEVRGQRYEVLNLCTAVGVLGGESPVLGQQSSACALQLQREGHLCPASQARGRAG